MKETRIVRKLDNLNRVVIPKALRKSLNTFSLLIRIVDFF